jgi:hypothetical protein
VSDILGLNEGKDWNDVRRELNDDHVRRIHEFYEFLWPTDTLLLELLPRPQEKTSRAVFLGPVDFRTLPLVATSWLDYFDELILPHPFPNPAGIRPESSPTKSPALYRDQTLRNVLMLLELEGYIRSPNFLPTCRGKLYQNAPHYPERTCLLLSRVFDKSPSNNWPIRIRPMARVCPTFIFPRFSAATTPRQGLRERPPGAGK